jgi:hypothetical protein
MTRRGGISLNPLSSFSKEMDHMAQLSAPRTTVDLLRRGRPLVALLATLVAFVAFSPAADAAPALSFDSFTAGALNADGTASTQAGAHPFEQVTNFQFATQFSSSANADIPTGALKDSVVELPAGVVGDPTIVPQCDESTLEFPTANCPTDTQVGYADVDVSWFIGRIVFHVPVYNVVHPPGVTARFRFVVTASVVHVDIKVRSDGSVTAVAHNANAGAPLYGVSLHLWGVPADSSHDALRQGPFGPAPGPIFLPRKPFLRNPTSCTGPTTTTIQATSWQEPDVEVEASSTAPATTGCAALPFAPSIAVVPDSEQAGSSAGYGIDLRLPQNENPDGLATSDLKKVAMTLPRGVAINPSSAAGLGSCSDVQFDVKSTDEDHCPNSSKIGDVEIGTPLLEKPLTGSMFLATPLEQNAAATATGQMYRLFLEAEGSGVRIKLPGSVVPDPATGQLTATFDNTPQQPFETLHVDLMGGPQAPLTTPQSCGTYTTHAELTPWARPTEPVSVNSSFEVNEGCGNASQFTPGLEAGSTNPVGGAFSPFVFRVTAPSGQQNLARIEATLPEGVLAKLAGVTVCGEAAAAGGNCPASSQVGTTTVGAGNGSSPIYVPQPGKAPTAVYLGGPYKGAPYSLVVKVPAQAGPFDLGTVTVRNALVVDPSTAQVTARSDFLPQILLGVPISYRDVRVTIDRDGFTLNPTSCDPMKVTSTLTSAAGATANPSDRFQVASCERLAFKPGLSLSFKGGTRRTQHPALRSVLTYPKAKSANIGRVQVTLPRTEFIDPARVSNPCTRPQFAEGKCPKGSILGTATAYTPLLDKPLSGKVYFRANGGERDLPDIVADLNGQIHVVLVGFVDAQHKQGSEVSRVRTTFATVPDAPVSKFVLNLKGGKEGLLQNSGNLCKTSQQAMVKMTGQNGNAYDTNPVIANGCGHKKPAGTSRRGG